MTHRGDLSIDQKRWQRSCSFIPVLLLSDDCCGRPILIIMMTPRGGAGPPSVDGDTPGILCRPTFGKAVPRIRSHTHAQQVLRAFFRTINSADLFRYSARRCRNSSVRHADNSRRRGLIILLGQSTSQCICTGPFVLWAALVGDCALFSSVLF
jgi:hypothetical protein